MTMTNKERAAVIRRLRAAAKEEERRDYDEWKRERACLDELQHVPEVDMRDRAQRQVWLGKVIPIVIKHGFKSWLPRKLVRRYGAGQE